MHLRDRRCDVDMSPAPGSWRRVLTLALLAGAAVPGGRLPSLYKSQIFDGSTTTLSFEHGVARLVLHEIDHLAGRLYTDRLMKGSLIPHRAVRGHTHRLAVLTGPCRSSLRAALYLPISLITRSIPKIRELSGS